MKSEFQANLALAASQVKNCPIAQAYLQREKAKQAAQIEKLSYAERLALMVA